LPIESELSKTPFHRLMIAQDTGSAIVGPARADLYFGAGVDAGRQVSVRALRGRFRVDANTSPNTNAIPTNEMNFNQSRVRTDICQPPCVSRDSMVKITTY